MDFCKWYIHTWGIHGIHGGTSLDMACMGDRSLTDIVHGKLNRYIRVGSMCFDLTNLAQVILPDGLTFRQEVREGGSWNKHEDSTEWEGLNSPTYIRQALGIACMEVIR